MFLIRPPEYNEACQRRANHVMAQNINFGGIKRETLEIGST